MFCQTNKLRLTTLEIPLPMEVRRPLRIVVHLAAHHDSAQHPDRTKTDETHNIMGHSVSIPLRYRM